MRASKSLSLQKTIQIKKFYKTRLNSFSYIYPNFPPVASYYNYGKQVVLDSFITYDSLIEEFLKRRWVTKQEIPPKIKIMPTSSSLKEILATQKKFKTKKVVALDENILRYMHDGGYLDRNYLYNVLFEKNEIDLNKEILDKVVMNGYTIKYFNNDSVDQNISKKPSSEYEEYNKMCDRVGTLVKAFYGQQEMSELENNLQSIYINKKWKKFLDYKQTKDRLYHCVFTDNDVMLSKGFIWFPDIEFKKEKFNLTQTLAPINIDKYMDTVLLNKKLGKNYFGKFLAGLTVNEFYYKNIHKVKIMAQIILSRLFIYLNSEEFSRLFDCELDFYIFNAMVSLHLWLICQRLQNFKRSKLATDLVDEIMRLHKNYANREFQQIDTLRKISKFRNINEIYEDQKYTFHWHFNIYNPTVENNYYKIDALVWSQIFREKIPRYDNRVYKMSHYIIHHFHKFREHTFTDFENFNVNFDLDCIPPNYKEIVLVHNERLSDELNFRERYSDFVYKKYSYEYKQNLDKDKNHLKKTFIRHTHLSKFDRKNYIIRSRREEDRLYDELRDEENKREFEKKFQNEFESMDHEGSILGKLCENFVNKNFGEVIETCEREDFRREREEYNESYLKTVGKDEKVRFSENLERSVRDNLYKYRHTLHNNPKAEAENFKETEMKILHPDANVVTSRRKRKPLVDRLFNLKPY